VDAFDVRDPQVFVGSKELGTLLLLLRIFSYLGAALSSVLVANTLAAVMGEETAQIGIIKSLGGQRRHVLLTYLAYGALLGAAGTALGWLAGLIIGRGISAYLTGLTGLQQPGFSVAPREVALALLVGAFVTVTAAIVPVYAKSNARVASLLRSPGVRSEFRRPWLSRLTAPLARLHATLALGARNVLRRPSRTLSTIAVVAVAVAAFVATQALSRSVSGTVDELYALYGADAWIYFQRPIDTAYAADLKLDPHVVQAEPWTSASGSFGSTRTDIWGMPEHDPLYAYRLLAGTWVTQSNPPAIVISSNLAAAIDARLGDQRMLDVGDQAQTVQITGIVDDSSTYLGSTATGKAFMRVQDVNRLRGLGRSADIFALKFHASDPASVRAALQELENRTRANGPVTFAAYSDQQSAQRAINVLTLMLNAMVIVVGVVGMAGIANTLLISIAERRREFGVLRAIGGGTRHALAVLVSEGLTLALLGLLVGVAAGYPLARLMVDLTSAQLFALRFQLSLASLATTFAVALLAAAAVSAIPGLLAARIQPIQALRYE
jgi:putative ABC transport system permease protein